MSTLLSIFISDILPVFAIAGAGFLLARYLRADVRTLAHVVFYVGLPCLVFTLLVSSPETTRASGAVAGLAVVTIGTMGVIGFAVARMLRLGPVAARTFLVVVMFSNAGNYGLPVVRFAFGIEALTYATVFFVTSSVLTYTVGAFLAAGAAGSVRGALVRILRMPALYGLVAAVVVLAFRLSVPDGLMRPVGLMSDATLPLMILLLGMQLERAVRVPRLAVVGTAVGVSLLVTPLVALAATSIVGVYGPARQAVLTLASMPVAVATTILAIEFDLDADFVTNAVLLSTILSPLTLTPLIAYLG